jgi:hypothetical protein
VAGAEVNPRRSPRLPASPSRAGSSAVASHDVLGDLTETVARFIQRWPSFDANEDEQGAVIQPAAPAPLALTFGRGIETTRPRGHFIVQDQVVVDLGGWSEATVLLRDSADAGPEGYPFVARFIREPGRQWRLIALDPMCPSCFGSGLIDANTRLCDTCGGTGWGTGKMEFLTGEDTVPKAAG